VRLILEILRGDREAAAARVAELPELFSPGSAPSYLPCLVLRAAGMVEEAIDELRDRAADYESRGFDLVGLWCAYFLAETLVGRSRADDAREALLLLADVKTKAAAHGLVVLGARAESLHRTVVERTAGVHPGGLTPREIEVLRLVAAGRSNGEIAKRLFVSIKTVNTHVHHLLRKTGSANRAEAVSYAACHGLLAD
jgi:DNA-binding CsgD family transcriptional regulator